MAKRNTPKQQYLPNTKVIIFYSLFAASAVFDILTSIGVWFFIGYDLESNPVFNSGFAAVVIKILVVLAVMYVCSRFDKLTFRMKYLITGVLILGTGLQFLAGFSNLYIAEQADYYIPQITGSATMQYDGLTHTLLRDDGTTSNFTPLANAGLIYGYLIGLFYVWPMLFGMLTLIITQWLSGEKQ